MFNRSIGFFGGTFDPIHFGHCRAALEIKEAFTLSTMNLVPTHNPPHRNPPEASALHRLNMVKLAIEGSELSVDDQEMRREGPSYSIDTLMSLRKDFPKVSLSMIVGVDAFVGLPSWYRWEKLMQLTNIIVIHRSGWTLPATGPLAQFFKEHALDPNKKLTDFQNGKITTRAITALEISGSKIRALIKQGQSAQFLVPEKVWSYIQENALYGYNASSNSNSNSNGEVPSI